MKEDFFLPPCIQMRISARFGRIPRQATHSVCETINDLWMVRNAAPENEIEQIDARMERIIANMLISENGRKPRAIVEVYNLHGIGYRKHKVFVLPIRSRRDYWANVTNIPCPACDGGTVRWHEAGYVPGYRICDGCGRTFLASVAITNDKLPKLILDNR